MGTGLGVYSAGKWHRGVGNLPEHLREPLLHEQVVQEHLEGDFRPFGVVRAENRIHDLLGIVVEDIDVLVTDLAGLVIHDTDFAGGETVHPVDVALESETVIVEETLLFESEYFEGLRAMGVHALQVAGQDLHDILEDDILENEIAPADLKGVKLSHEK